MGHIILLPLRRKAYWGFSGRPKNPTASAGFEPANSGSRGQYANHWTTEAVRPLCYLLLSNCWSSYTGTVFGLNNHLYLKEFAVLRDVTCCLKHDKFGLNIRLLLRSQSSCIGLNSLEALVMDIYKRYVYLCTSSAAVVFCLFVCFSWLM